MTEKNELIIVTGAAGFIGSCMVAHLNENGYNNLILVDDFEKDYKDANWKFKSYRRAIGREDFFSVLEKDQIKADIIIHLGARTDTTEFDYSVHQKLNVDFSIGIWKHCATHNIPLIYASSAATYGAGEHGYSDDHQLINELKPLNPYGESKNEFDKWALQQNSLPAGWAGLKFFNVYGPNEYHKNRMASVIWHSFNQIQNTGQVKLFKSHKPGYDDGKQLRDFIYVKDVVKVIFWMMEAMLTNNWTAGKNGIYNLGTGEARTFNDLVTATFHALGLEPNIQYIDMPEDLRNTYQYFTEAEMHKLRSAGYTNGFYSLEEGINDYIKNYLREMKVM